MAANIMATRAATKMVGKKEHQYCLLDTQEKRHGHYPFSFELKPYGQTGANIIGVQGSLTHVVKMTVFPFMIPFPLQKTRIDDFIGGRVYLFFKELDMQAFSDVNGMQYHFEFKVVPVSSSQVELLPVNNTYKFTYAIPELQYLTPIFYDLSGPLDFPLDTLSVHVDSLTHHIHLPIQNHNLTMGDRVFVSGYKHLQTIETCKNNIIFIKDIPPLSSEKINLYIPKNRIRIPLYFKSLKASK
ncbi:BA71V-H240R (j7R) [African swine fever virus]|nr:BA71V-H240R (j7R) [African swine fever virus]